MLSLPPLDIGEILFVMGNFIYMVWFLLIVVALTARRQGLINALTIWIFELIVLIFITVYASSNPGIAKAMRLVPEPWNTYLFLLTGISLWIAYFVRRRRRNVRMQQ